MEKGTFTVTLADGTQFGELVEQMSRRYYFVLRNIPARDYVMR